MNESVQTFFSGKRFLVLGLAKSGLSVALLLKRMGAFVTVNEYKNKDQLSNWKELEDHGIELICGGHPAHLLDQNYNLIIKNPGIPYDIHFLEQAKNKGIPVVTEVEIGYLVTQAPIIGITGTNGKTTTTTLIHEMLKGGFKQPLIAGNIGTVFCDVAAQATENNWLVAELSSFQLLGIELFRPHISVLLNIYDAHLDYHHTKEHYIQAKYRLFSNQTSADICVLNKDQPLVAIKARELSCQVVYFSLETQVDRGSFLRDGCVYYTNSNGEEVFVTRQTDIRLLGRHNLENALAAVATSLEAGAPVDHVRKVLLEFQGIEHRLQLVRQLHGVHYYNDSKATNRLSTEKAIQAFDTPVILIAGGLDRGEDFSAFIPLFAERVKGLFVYGQNAAQLLEVGQQAGVKCSELADNVEQAVCAAHHIASSGDVVLLSPASASWDQFRSFEERGDMFIKSVHMLR